MMFGAGAAAASISPQSQSSGNVNVVFPVPSDSNVGGTRKGTDPDGIILDKE